MAHNVASSHSDQGPARGGYVCILFWSLSPQSSHPYVITFWIFSIVMTHFLYCVVTLALINRTSENGWRLKWLHIHHPWYWVGILKKLDNVCTPEFLRYTLQSCLITLLHGSCLGSDIRVSGSNPDSETLGKPFSSPQSCCHYIKPMLWASSEVYIWKNK